MITLVNTENVINDNTQYMELKVTADTIKPGIDGISGLIFFSYSPIYY